eukprot:g13980.t1
MAYLLLFFSAVLYLSGLRIPAAVLVVWVVFGFVREYLRGLMTEVPTEAVRVVDAKRLAALCKGPLAQAGHGTSGPTSPGFQAPAKFEALKEPALGRNQLRAVLYRPVEPTPFAHVGLVFTHPWAMMGGDMHNNVPSVLSQVFAQLGFTTARFNFRGVGISRGNSEVDDCESMAVALRALPRTARFPQQVRKVIVVGYSHGSISASAAGGSSASFAGFVSLSPPLGFIQVLTLFNGDSMRRQARTGSKPKLLICGDQDSFTDKSTFLAEAARYEPPRQTVLVEGADHFWFGTEKALAALIYDWILANQDSLLLDKESSKDKSTATAASSTEQTASEVRSAAGQAAQAATTPPNDQAKHSL